jgi:AcrR family transcriptional regulator
MAKPRQALENRRRIPRQTRAEDTVAAILEGAAQVLEAGGLANFTTNAVAERAGVSIGTLYQYFGDKNALMVELARRELNACLASIAAALQAEAQAPAEARIRAVVRAIISAFGGRQRARKAVIQAVLSQGIATTMLAPVGAFIADLGARSGNMPDPVFPRLGREQIFVLTRAMMGAIRAAVLEEQPFFKSRAFEDEIVRLMMGYLRSIQSPLPLAGEGG